MMIGWRLVICLFYLHMQIACFFHARYQSRQSSTYRKNGMFFFSLPAIVFKMKSCSLHYNGFNFTLFHLSAYRVDQVWKDNVWERVICYPEVNYCMLFDLALKRIVIVCYCRMWLSAYSGRDKN